VQSSNPHEILHFDVGGYRMAYRTAGAGAPVLLVHGSMSDYRVWAAQVPALAERHRVLAVSLRHCYPEVWDGQGNDFTVARHAKDLAAFISGAALGKTHVVGHSRGGAVALMLASHHPELVATLVLADPGGLEGMLPDTPDARELAQQSARMFAQLKRDLEAGDIESGARSFVDALGGAGTWERRSPEQRQILLDNIHTGPACAERPSFTSADVRALNVPTLLITAANSPRRYPLMLEAMQRHAACVEQLITIPAAAHAMNRDNPHAFNAALMAFLARR
jgi:esterase